MDIETTTTRKNPVIRTAKWAMNMMRNKIIVTLFMIITGISFIVAPQGNMDGTVRLAAVVVIAAAAINILIRMIPKDRSKLDIFLSFLNLVLIVLGVICLIIPSLIEPFVRTFVAVVTILTNLVSIFELFKLENKKSLRFIIGVFASVIMIGLGVTMIIAGEEKIAAMQQGVGIFLILNALVNLWPIIRLHFEARKAKSAAAE